MLSAERRKTKWSSDPRNSAWLKDETKFGFKMLEKMGWEKGKGLGASKNGIVEPIKVKNKCGTNWGVGFTHSHENKWVDHQDDFSSLLAELNNNSCTVNETTTKTTFASLEKKSKTQKRLHYKKFTKGKDLSNYKASDMAAIFGSKVSHSLPSTPNNLSETEDSSIQVESSSEAECVLIKRKRKRKKTEISSRSMESKSVPTFNSKYNMEEYFKIQLEKAKSKNDPVITVTSHVMNEELTSFSYSKNKIDNSNDTEESNLKIKQEKRKKKKKHRKQNLD